MKEYVCQSKVYRDDGLYHSCELCRDLEGPNCSMRLTSPGPLGDSFEIFCPTYQMYVRFVRV